MRGSNLIPPHDHPVLCHDVNAAPGLSHLLQFLLHRPPPHDLRAASPSLSLCLPVKGGVGDGGLLVGNRMVAMDSVVHRSSRSRRAKPETFRSLYQI